MVIKSLLQHILIEPEALTQQEIDHILNQTKYAEESAASINKEDENFKIEPAVNTEIRDVKEVDIINILPDVTDIYARLITNIINPSYGFEIHSSEPPSLLKYEKGGHYLPHVDGFSQWKSPTGEVIWRKSVDRDLSTVIFLNDNFQGGEFVFPDFRIKITPEPGMLICFPSNQYYNHGVYPVKAGTRYSMVNWMTIKGFQTLEENTKEINEKYGLSPA